MSQYNSAIVWGSGLDDWVYHSSHKWYSPKIEMKSELNLLWRGGIYTIGPGFTSDGYSAPKAFIVLTAFYVRSIMPGLAPALFHDLVCNTKSTKYSIDGKYRLLTKKDRRQMFRDVAHASSHRLGQLRARMLWRSVWFGSRFLNYC